MQHRCTKARDMPNDSRRKIKVLTYGTFDLFHYGHLRILQRAAALGDHLIVAVSTDEFNLVKGKECYYPFEQRAQIVQAIEWVDEVIAEENWNQKKDDILEHGIDIFVMGDDWKGKFDHLSAHCDVVYLPRTEGISTTTIKHDLSKI